VIPPNPLPGGGKPPPGPTPSTASGAFGASGRAGRAPNPLHMQILATPLVYVLGQRWFRQFNAVLYFWSSLKQSYFEAVLNLQLQMGGIQWACGGLYKSKYSQATPWTLYKAVTGSLR
jgi:hypothetical protein